MLSQGQTWGRAKVTPSEGPSRGALCGNSWNRDDGTNYLDWQERNANRELVYWYGALIRWRRASLLPALAAGGRQQFVDVDSDLGVGFWVATGSGRCAALFHSDPNDEAHFLLPGGPWRLVLGDATLHEEERGQGVRLQGCRAAILQTE